MKQTIAQRLKKTLTEGGITSLGRISNRKGILRVEIKNRREIIQANKLALDAGFSKITVLREGKKKYLSIPSTVSKPRRIPNKTVTKKIPQKTKATPAIKKPKSADIIQIAPEVLISSVVSLFTTLPQEKRKGLLEKLIKVDGDNFVIITKKDSLLLEFGRKVQELQRSK